MTIKTKSENKAVFETGDVPTGANFSDLIDSYEDAGAVAAAIALIPGYLEYQGTVYQESTSAPLLVTLKTTLGTPTASRLDTGLYMLTFPTAVLTYAKTVCHIGLVATELTIEEGFVGAEWYDASSIAIATRGPLGLRDSVMCMASWLEIRVYP